MGRSTPRLVKPTLDKDLDKISYVEEASHYVSRSLAGPGIALIFLVLAMMFAGTYMTQQSGAVVVIAGAALAGYMAMNIGANDVTNNIGAAVGARAMTLGVGLSIAAVFEIAGALIAGGHVADTISNGIIDPALMPGSDALIWAMMAALLSSALWINLATWVGAPISTTHSIVGGVMGAGVAASGLSAINWTSMAGIAVSWMVSPLLGGVIAAAFLWLIKECIIYRPDKIAAARRWVPILIGTMAGVFTAYLTLVGLSQVISVGRLGATATGIVAGLAVWGIMRPVIRHQSVGLENRNQSLRKLFQIPLICSAALLSFAHGANDVSNAIGPLSAIVHATQAHLISERVQIPFWVMLIGAFGISLGLLLYGPKLIRLVGEQITKLNPMRAFCVALSAALTVIVASWFGLPVSSTHIAIGAVFGVGFFREWYTRHAQRRVDYMRVKAEHWDIEKRPERNPDEQRRRHLVRRSHFLTIIAAWVITVPAAGSLAAVLYWLMVRLFV